MIDLTGANILAVNSVVTYRIAQGSGILEVRVWLNTTTPRIMASSQRGKEVLPASLFIDEIEGFIFDAQERLGL